MARSSWALPLCLLIGFHVSIMLWKHLEIMTVLPFEVKEAGKIRIYSGFSIKTDKEQRP